MVGEIIELVGTAIQGIVASAETADGIHRRFGWAGCSVALAILVGVVGAIAWAIIGTG